MIITHVAIDNGVVYTLPKPYRHHHIIKMMINEYDELAPIIGEQGFVTDTGKFLDRESAATLALQNGQCNELDSPPELFSEDLW